MMLALLAALLAAPVGADCGSADAALTGDGVGALRIGARVEVVRGLCRILSDRIVSGDEDIPTRMLRVKLAKGVVEAEEDEGKVWRIQIDTPDLRTNGGLGVGSSITDLLRLSGLEGELGEGSLYVFTPRLCGMSFKLNYEPNQADGREAWTTGHLSRLPRTTKVTQVLLYGCGRP